jgi:hypothetical protein
LVVMREALNRCCAPLVYSDRLASALSQSGHHDRHRCLAVVVKPALHCLPGFVWSGWQVARWLACGLLQAFGLRV